MNSLNLIDERLSTIRYKSVIFPDGQPHIKIDMSSVSSLDKNQVLYIYTRISSPADLLLLLFAKNALDYLEFNKVELYISYLMAARMDRVMLDGEPFSLKVVANLLNSANFQKIKIFDPHSEVSTALIDKSYSITNCRFVKDVMEEYFNGNGKERFCIVSPDAGALKKIHKLASELAIKDVVECMKERDVKTGALISFKTTVSDLSGVTCFIIDDICDGGGTFAGTAQMLKEKEAAKVILIVSHGIFSKGTVIANVDEAYCSNSFKNVEGVNCYDVMKYLQ
ncbi:MAG: ribose-phosphate diphosphokinase [Ferruginibacter sp.]